MKKKNKEFNAASARALSKKNELEGLDELLEAIQSKAEEQKTELTYDVSLIPGSTEAVVKELKRRGFKASVEYDQRDGDYLSIEW